MASQLSCRQGSSKPAGPAFGGWDEGAGWGAEAPEGVGVREAGGQGASSAHPRSAGPPRLSRPSTHRSLRHMEPDFPRIAAWTQQFRVPDEHLPQAHPEGSPGSQHHAVAWPPMETRRAPEFCAAPLLCCGGAEKASPRK